MARAARNICEIDFNDRQWKAELGELSQSADTIILHNFCPTFYSLSFIRAISWKHHLIMSSIGDDLVFARLGANRAPRQRGGG